MKKVLFFLIFLLCLPTFADQFVPDFNNMQILRCEVDETLYNQDNSVVTKTNYHRIFRIDDEFSRLYLQKEPIYKILGFNEAKIEFSYQSMSDDYIIYSNISIDRENNLYNANSRITYDNPDYPPRYSKAEGTCKILD